MKKKKYTITLAKQSAKFTQSPWAIYFIDPVSVRLTYLIANNTSLTPNFITMLSIILGIISAFLFLKGTYYNIVIASFLLLLSFTLDSIDGKLARLTGQISELGKKLDFFRDKVIHTLNLIALCYGYYDIYNDPQIFVLGFIYYSLLFLVWSITRLSSRYGMPFTSFDVIPVVFLIGPLINKVYWGLALGSFLLFLLEVILLKKKVFNNSTRTTNLYPCPFCGKKRSKIIHFRTRAKYQVNQCSKCSLVFRVPMPSKEKIKTFYQKGYVEFLLTGKSANGALFAYDIETSVLEKESFLKRIKFDAVVKSIPDKTMFEIGTGTGNFLNICEKRGFKVTGCDLSLDCVNYAKTKFGYDIKQEYFEDMNIPENSYSFVSMWSIIEHVREPKRVMQKVYKILKPGGFVIVACPNVDAFRHLVVGSAWNGFTIGHTLFFSKETLREVLKNAGFTNIKSYYKHPTISECFNRKVLRIDAVNFGIANKQALASFLIFSTVFLRQIFRYLSYRIAFAQPGKIYITARKE